MKAAELQFINYYYLYRPALLNGSIPKASALLWHARFIPLWRKLLQENRPAPSSFRGTGKKLDVFGPEFIHVRKAFDDADLLFQQRALCTSGCFKAFTDGLSRPMRSMPCPWNHETASSPIPEIR